MIPIKFLIIFRELRITQCLRSHRHRQHLWHILMLHPYTLTPLSLESQSTEPLPERKYGASREAEGGQAWEENWQAQRFGTTQPIAWKRAWRGGGEG